MSVTCHTNTFQWDPLEPLAESQIFPKQDDQVTMQRTRMPRHHQQPRAQIISLNDALSYAVIIQEDKSATVFETLDSDNESHVTIGNPAEKRLLIISYVLTK